MLIGINQNTSGLLRAIRSNGCLFLCFANESPIVFEGSVGVKVLNALWEAAKDSGVINSDDELVDHNALANNFFGLKLKYDGEHHDAYEDIPEDVAFIVGKFVWKYGHFVIINRDKKVIFDPLVKSNSVQYGALQSMRWYYHAN